MKLPEYQAKDILTQYGIPIPKGIVVDTSVRAAAAAGRLGPRVVLKAQILTGG